MACSATAFPSNQAQPCLPLGKLPYFLHLKVPPRVDDRNAEFEDTLRRRPRRFEPIHPAEPVVDFQRPLPRRSLSASHRNTYKDVPCRCRM